MIIRRAAPRRSPSQKKPSTSDQPTINEIYRQHDWCGIRRLEYYSFEISFPLRGGDKVHLVDWCRENSQRPRKSNARLDTPHRKFTLASETKIWDPNRNVDSGLLWSVSSVRGVTPLDFSNHPPSPPPPPWKNSTTLFRRPLFPIFRRN